MAEDKSQLVTFHILFYKKPYLTSYGCIMQNSADNMATGKVST